MFGELGRCAEMTAVVRHMEHRLKGNPPRVSINIRLIRLLSDQYRRCPVQFSRQIQISFGSEQRRRQRVGIKKFEVVCAEADLTLFFVNIGLFFEC